MKQTDMTYVKNGEETSAVGGASESLLRKSDAGPEPDSDVGRSVVGAEPDSDIGTSARQGGKSGGRDEPAATSEHGGRSKRSKILHYLHGLLGLALLVVVLQWVDFQVLGETIAKTDLRFILLMLVAGCLDRFLMSYKWNLLMASSGLQLSHLEAFKLYLASGFAGIFLPGGVGGDAFRAVRTTMGGHGVGGVTASIVVERAIGIFVVVSTAIAALSVVVAGGEAGMRGLLLGASGLLVAFLIALFISVHPSTFAWARRVLSRFEKYKLVRMYLEIHGAYVEFARKPRVLLLFALLTFVEMGVVILVNYLGAKAIGLEIGLFALAAIVPLATIAVRLPISIGGIGVQEGAYMLLFARVGVAPTEALSLALVCRVVEWLILVPMGLAFLFDIFSFRRQRAEESVGG